MELLEELVEKLRVIAPKADKAWVELSQFMAESSVNYFRQRVFGRSLKVTRQPDLAYFAAEFKVTLR